MALAPDTAAANGTHALVLEGVGRSFGALVALEGISFAIEAGERLAILGANGAGKTTLFNVITGDYRPDKGRVVFFGEDVTTLPTHERIRRGIRRTYQSSILFRSLSVADNLYLAACGVTRGRFSVRRPPPSHPNMIRTRELASLAGLTEVIEVAVGDLSHGQQRQLEVALALAGAPRVILFDEPAAGLSPIERRHLIALLRGLPKHIGYIIIEHDLDVALRVADKVTVMHHGRIFKQGTPEQIESDAEVQAIYLGGAHHG
jgi:branched-chain amino acid transport system ATP-binding protein